jgi:hypothetical protein
MKQPEFSSDLQKLQTIIKIDAEIRSVRWEVFGTPEYTGGVPGPTDYVTLVAEAEIAASQKLSGLATAGTTWIAPEAPRVWLSENFKTLLDRYRNGYLDYSAVPACAPVKALLVSTNRVIEGLACRDAAKTLLYFTIADNTAMSK